MKGIRRMRRIIFSLVLITVAAGILSAKVVYKNNSFIITLPNLKQPLLIGSEESPIFMQTKQEKFYLKDSPSDFALKDNGYAASWSFDGGKKVTVRNVFFPRS